MSSLHDSGGEALVSLCYRYWFWGWLFADASSPDPVLRRHRWRQNVAARGWLVTYARRWFCFSAALGLAARVLELLDAPLPLAATLYTAAIVAGIVAGVAMVAWAFLSRAAAS